MAPFECCLLAKETQEGYEDDDLDISLRCLTSLSSSSKGNEILDLEVWERGGERLAAYQRFDTVEYWYLWYGRIENLILRRRRRRRRTSHVDPPSVSPVEYLLAPSKSAIGRVEHDRASSMELHSRRWYLSPPLSKKQKRFHPSVSLFFDGGIN